MSADRVEIQLYGGPFDGESTESFLAPPPPEIRFMRPMPHLPVMPAASGPMPWPDATRYHTYRFIGSRNTRGQLIYLSENVR